MLDEQKTVIQFLRLLEKIKGGETLEDNLVVNFYMRNGGVFSAPVVKPKPHLKIIEKDDNESN